MSERNRRRAERHTEEALPVSVVFEESVELHGQTIDWSSQSILMAAYGRISVQVTIEGQTYQGQLVRAFPTESATTAYGIELLTPLALARAGWIGASPQGQGQHEEHLARDDRL